MKITDYPSQVEIKENNVFLMDGPNGTRQISAIHLADKLVRMDGGVDAITDRLNSLNETIESKNGEYDKAIEDLKKSVADGKSAIASAITQKGVTTNGNASFSDMANNIGKITTDYQIWKSSKIEQQLTVGGGTGTSDEKTNTINFPYAYKKANAYITDLYTKAYISSTGGSGEIGNVTTTVTMSGSNITVRSTSGNVSDRKSLTLSFSVVVVYEPA